MPKFWDMVDSETKDKAESFIKRIKSKEIVKMVPPNVLKNTPLDGTFKKLKGKAKRLSDRLACFLRRRSAQSKMNKMVRRELESILKDARYRKTIQGLARFR